MREAEATHLNGSIKPIDNAKGGAGKSALNERDRGS